LGSEYGIARRPCCSSQDRKGVRDVSAEQGCRSHGLCVPLIKLCRTYARYAFHHGPRLPTTCELLTRLTEVCPATPRYQGKGSRKRKKPKPRVFRAYRILQTSRDQHLQRSAADLLLVLLLAALRHSDLRFSFDHKYCSPKASQTLSILSRDVCANVVHLG
jgi:hypothetical protein